jgi:serine/threonine protein kinase
MRMIFIWTVVLEWTRQKKRCDPDEGTAMTVYNEHRLNIPPFTGWILSEYDEPSIVEGLKTCSALLDEARILEESRNRVGVVALPGRDEKTREFVVKEFRVQGVNRWKSILLPSKAQKAWRGSLALIERGFLTPRPVAYCERKTSLFLDQSYFITEYVPGLEEVRAQFRELPHDALIPLLRELGRYLARCTERGILHRDLSDGNVLVEREEDGQFRFFLLDTNRIRCRKHIGTFKGIKGLIRLGVPLELQRYFLEAYLSPSSVKRVHWSWYRLNKSCFSMYIRLKKSLRLKKLAQKLKIQ